MTLYYALIGLIGVAISLVLNLNTPGTTIFFNAVVIDPFSTLMKLTMVLGTIGVIYLGEQSSEIYPEFKTEFGIMVIGTLIGGMILASANNMLTVYVGVETLSILSYALASFRKNNELSSEAGLKYSLFGGVSAALMLFGLSHLYGIFGTIQFTGIVEKLSQLTTTEIYFVLPSMLLVFAGLGYKIACVPFHMWSPDVYEGSPLPVTTFFSIVPKLAGIAVILRVTHIFFNDTSLLSTTWLGLIVVISALTMTVGNVAAIGQQSVKRMLAYSSISHGGFMLMGAAVVGPAGVSSVLFYGLAYLFMTLVAFYVVGLVADHYGNDDFNRFNGLIKRHPVMTLVLSISMVSLAGIPPFGGFVAKFNLLSAVLAKKQFGLAVIAGLNSVVSLYYYMKIVRYMVFGKEESNEPIPQFNLANSTIIVAFTVPLLVLGIFWGGFAELAQKAVLITF